MLTSGFYHNMMTGKRLKPLYNTHYCPRQIGKFLLSLYGRESANILNKHNPLLSDVSISRSPKAVRLFETKDNKMNTQLTFKNHTLTPVIINNQPYLTASQVGIALNYARPDKINSIYQSHRDEFTSDMTCTTDLVLQGQNRQVRVFSLRGCHLLAMFSKTPVAKEFRRWVLDLIEQRHMAVSSLPVSLTQDDRKTIGGIVCDEQEIREAKYFLTSCLHFDYTESLKTAKAAFTPVSIGDFFIPAFMADESRKYIEYRPEPSLAAFSESATSQSCVALLKKAKEMQNLISYTFKSTQIRTTVIEGEPWFVATDVAQALEYRAANDAIRTLDDDEKGTHILRTLGGNQELTIINESGLYSLILRSRKPEAKAFKKFVTAEVLPAIRRQGYYAAPSLLQDKDTRKTIGGIVKRCCEVVIKEQLDGRTITKTVDALSDFDFPAMPEKEELNPHLVRDALRAMIAQIGFRMDYRDACYSSLEKLRSLFLALQATFERYDTIRMETLFACSMMDGNGRYDKKQALSRIIELNQIAPKGTLKLKQAVN